MNSISGALAARNAYDHFTKGTGSAPPEQQLLLRETFQDFVAGTFYRQMFKSMRRMHDKPAYFHGGSAEEIFQSQMDQQVAEDLARENGAAFADPLFQAFARRLQLAEISSTSAQVPSPHGTSASNQPAV